MSKTVDKAGWAAAKFHEVTCPSGTKVKIALPNLPALIKSGQIPNELLEVAMGADEDTEVSRESVEQMADFYNYLVSTTVVEPTITPDDVPDLPYEDVEMIAAFALRQRDTDAAYHHIGGLEKVAAFREARKLDGN